MNKSAFTDFALRLRDDDDVAVAKRDLRAGTELDGAGVRLVLRDAVPAGHKVALRDIAAGGPVRKYGQVIGFATRDIAAGEHVHSHNLAVKDFGRDYAFCADARAVDYYPPDQRPVFQGYLRPDGRVGTRNYIAVISTVNCSADVARHVQERFARGDMRRDWPNVDGVVAFTHRTGCCVQPGEPARLLHRVLGGMARHPNIFGYVMIGLGCEGNQIADVVAANRLNVLRDGELPGAFMTIQQTGGVAKTVDAAVAAVARLLPLANSQKRTPQPASKLMLAMNCGGSDGNSGITANPALGVASDELVRAGGTSVLAETPEIYGAEHLLTRRAVQREVGEKLISFIRWWEQHVRLHGASIDNNPTPGNKEGGLTTIYEKSLGAVAKGGQSPLAAVYGYAERIEASGLCFMDTPGFDPVSMTGLVAGGCNIGCFTTGRGSVYGCKPSPCIKIATNSVLYNHMIDDMDINAGTILDGTETLAEVGRRIFAKLIAVASGEKTKSEAQGIGDEEFAPWVLGPTL